MRKSSLINRRHRNPQVKEGERQQPFFSKSNAGVVQKKEDHLPFFQAKLAIGQPGDKYEQEADAVANQVVNAPGSSPQIQQKEISTIQRSTLTENQEEKPVQAQKEEEEPVQMMPSNEKEEEGIQMQVEEEEEPLQKKESEEEELQMQQEEEEPLQRVESEEEEELQMKSETVNTTAKPQLSSRIQGKRGKGKPIPKNDRSYLENAFGTDFSGVNIHTDAESVQMNKELGAQAFTHGEDVYFNAGKYRPENSEGKRLLAHELTHVVQQKGANTLRKKSRKGDSINHHSEGPILQKQQAPSRWETLKKGAKVYLGTTLKDEGSAYAKALMRHYAMGRGSEFNPEALSFNFPTDSMWDSFMSSRPEIQTAMYNKFESLALEKVNSGAASGKITTHITGVRLNQLESMRLTLHGCHRIDLEGDFTIVSGKNSQYLTFSNMRFAWIDVGDMHPGTVTETDSGEQIDDVEFTGAGSSYPIKIPFTMQGTSNWLILNGTDITKLFGWPNPVNAKSKQNRG